MCAWSCMSRRTSRDRVLCDARQAETERALGAQVDLVLNVRERKTGGLSAGGGISAQGHAQGALPGFIGSASYAQRNLLGLNQKLSATVELGQARARAGGRPAHRAPRACFNGHAERKQRGFGAWSRRWRFMSPGALVLHRWGETL